MNTLETHRQAYAYCTYCPKICRFSCPVSDSTHTETTSTWGKMTRAHLATHGERPLTPEGGAALYACTGCMRCRSFCRHENEVGPALFAARDLAVRTGNAPRGATSTLATFEQHGNPFGATLPERVRALKPDAAVRFPLFPGCSTLMKRPELIDRAKQVGAGLGATFGVARASAKCCGYPLYAAGDHEGFARHAKSVVRELRSSPELAVLDPGCAFTLKVAYPRAGVEHSIKVKTVYEVLAERLAHVELPPLPERVAYQDACHLGRGLGQYGPPRELLRRAVESLVAEPEGEGGCSGGGGLLPRTAPETSVDVARRQAEALTHGDDVLLVSACPTSVRMLQRAGKRAEDLLSVIGRWLEGEVRPGTSPQK